MTEDKAPNNGSTKTDLRVQKTYEALYDSLYMMLRKRNFNEITVNDLCAKAFVSRATFYAHFNDKYDLLRCFLTRIRENTVKDVYNYEELEKEVNRFVHSNKKVISNVLKYANSETLGLLREFMSSVVDLAIRREIRNKTSPQHIILSNFFIGGLINLLTWIVENNYPPEIEMMSIYLYNMLTAMTIWDAQQEQKKQPLQEK